jgi:undecaprenyl-diphosphatase
VKGAVSLVGSVVLVGYVGNVASNWHDIWTSLRDARVAAIVPLVVFVVTTFAGGALSLMGAVVTDLPFVRTLEVMFAQSFLNRFTPANAGGMALRARYLQLEGVDATAAAAAVGLTSVASGVAQVVFVAVFLVWGGATSSLGRFSLPSAGRLLTFLIVAGAVVGAVTLSTWGKRVVLPLVARTVRKVSIMVRDIVSRPGKLALLLGGAALSKLAILLAFVISVHAFGVHMGLAQAGALYMVANTVGAAVPTPGGVGGIEAALTAALLGAGVDAANAAAIVVLFRLFTFWLPTLPGWLMLQYTQRAGIV